MGAEILNKSELAKAIMKVAYLKGEFLLRSGKISSEYFDKYRFEGRPELLRSVAYHMQNLIPSDAQVLAGLEMGGIPIATALSLTTELPACFVRKEAKEYGTRNLAEGEDFKSKKLLVIEDVITTGGQVVSSVQDLRDLGAEIDTVLCVIDRSEGQTQKLKEAGLKLISLFTIEELLRHKSQNQ